MEEAEFDVLDIRYGPMTRTFITNTDRTSIGVFTAYTYPLRPDLRLTGGLRYDDPDDFDGELTFSAGLEKDISPKTQFHIHYGRGAGFPIPTTGDIAADNIPPVERSHHVDLGWTVRPNADRIAGLSLFWSDVSDGSVLYNDPPGAIGPDAWLSKVEDIETYGLEFTYQQRFDGGEWFANYTYMERDVTNNNSPAIPGTAYPNLESPPENLATAGVRIANGGTRYALTGRWAESYLAQNRLMSTAYPVDSFVVFNLKVTQQMGGGELAVLVDNLFNASYETMPAFPRPGRNYLFSYSQAF